MCLRLARARSFVNVVQLQYALQSHINKKKRGQWKLDIYAWPRWPLSRLFGIDKRRRISQVSLRLCEDANIVDYNLYEYP